MQPRVAMAVLVLINISARAAERVDYLREIKPILRERCYACHGALQQQAGLRLDTAALIRRGGESGPAVVAGDEASSPLIQRIASPDAAIRMPQQGKPLSAEQIDAVRAWIAQGSVAPDNEQREADPREHWAFKRPARPALPQVSSDRAVFDPIDDFIAARLAEQGLTPRPAAEKHFLLRRVYLDLIGLPPTPDELQAFLADDSPTAYEAVVERLLNDPRHGERWGRHWMDIWRYSDWYGRRHVPDVWNSAPQIWRWRDWIVQSLNADKGYDRMILEMLAADEVCPEDDEATVATGYLIRNWYALNPNDWLRNTLEHTGKAFLGLTFNCAHCHDHKYDPIRQDDYFRLRAFFEPMHLRQDRVPGEADPGPFQEYNYSTLRKIQRLGAVRIYDKTRDAPTWFYTDGDERNRVKERGSIPPGVPAFLSDFLPAVEPVELPSRFWYPGSRESIRKTALAECRAAIDQHCAASDRVGEAKLAAAHAELASVEARIAADRAKFSETPNADLASLAHAASRLEREACVKKTEAEVRTQELTLSEWEAKPTEAPDRAKKIEATTKQLATARAAVEKAEAALADMSQPEAYTPFSPTFPKTSTGRRRALAEWIVSPRNPLTARVAVNHIWARHFHAPLVATVNDFGRNGAPPTQPELLDWLAVELIESGWSMKGLHRRIVTSAVYRRASAAGAASREMEIDPENKLLWRMNSGRMEAEVVRDSLLYLAGRLDPSMGGQELENSEALTTYRRSLYYSVYPEAGGKSPFGELFDAPDALECYRRTRSIVPQQALALTNSDLVHQVAAAVLQQCDRAQDRDFLIAAFARILSRAPTYSELAICMEALKQQSKASVVRALLNHNDFITVR